MKGSIEQFRDAMLAAGLVPPETIDADGSLYRFASNGKRGDDSGWYVLHSDGIPAGCFGDWRTGLLQTWRADIGRALTPAEQAAHRERIEVMKRERDAWQEQVRAEAASKAAAIWDRAAPCTEHPYLSSKGIQASGARLYKESLVIPLRAEGALHSLQFIGADGEKRFLTGGRVAGCYCSIGNTKGAEALCIVEGFATGATIHESTGHPVAVAFNAGNLEAVALAMRAKFSDLPIIVCADDDWRSEGNPGKAKATAAALAIGGRLAIPQFGEARPEGATDFNDMAANYGAEAVKQAVGRAEVPAMQIHQPDADMAAANDLEGWPEPLPMPNALPPVMAFDFDLLPDALRPWIEDIAERVQCPPDFPAVGAMISLAAVVGRKIGVRPKRQDDWLEVPNLWGAIVGRPGMMKSPALRASMQHLQRLEARAREGFEDALATWNKGQELHKLKREGERAAIVKAIKCNKQVSIEDLPDAFAEPEPQARRYVVNDSSVEALGVILQANPNGTLAYRDELIGLLKSLDKEGNEGARGFYLSAWSGTDAYTFDRIGRGLDMRIHACCLSLLGSIQPAIIGGYLKQAVAGGGGDGLLSRFQLLVWPDHPGDWRNVDRWPDTDAKARAFATFERLDTLQPETVGALIEADAGIPYLRFDDEAQGTFNEWREDFERRIQSGGDHAAIESHLAKYRKLVPALALLIHLCDSEGGPIGNTALLKSLAWAEYLESHARRAYASVAQAEAIGARALMQRIKRGEVSNPFTPRDVYLKHWANLGTPEEAHDAVRYLTDLDYLRKEDRPTGGRPKAAIWINPKARAA